MAEIGRNDIGRNDIGRNDEEKEGKIANQLRYVRVYHQTLLFYQESTVFL